MPGFNLSVEQYEALVFLAKRGAQSDPSLLVQLDQFLRSIEKANGVNRDFLWVQWQELSAPLPQGTRFPESWPAKLRKSIELVTRRIAKVDVEQVLSKYASDPITVLVTRDPAGLVGWTPIDDFFSTGVRNRIFDSSEPMSVLADPLVI